MSRGLKYWCDEGGCGKKVISTIDQIHIYDRTGGDKRRLVYQCQVCKRLFIKKSSDNTLMEIKKKSNTYVPKALFDII